MAPCLFQLLCISLVCYLFLTLKFFSMVMINGGDSEVKIGVTEYDTQLATSSVGTYGMRKARNRRDGRNPSTGARTSRRFGQVITFATGYLPLQQGSSDPIY